MNNIGLFITLLVGIQGAFFVADGWTAYEERRLPRRELARLSLFVAVTAAIYFGLQLALASLIPDFRDLLTFFDRRLGIALPTTTISPAVSTLIVLFAAAYVLGTLFDYLVHRFVLHGWLFPLHENHHLPTTVSNLMPGIAARPFVAIPNLMINAATALVLLAVIRVTGRPVLIDGLDALILPLVLVFGFIACASHSSFLRRFRRVDRVFRSLAIVTPREHLVHHAAHLNGNYGNFTMIWDRLFGTYVPPPAEPPVTGLSYDQDFLGVLTGGRVKLSPSARAYFSIHAVCRITLDKAEHDAQNVPGSQ